MSHDLEWNRDDRDALLTAYALDMASPEERAAVERLLADPTATTTRAEVDEIRALSTALKAARAEEQPERSADLRRAVLAAAVGQATVPPAEPSQPRRWHRFATWALAIGSCAAAVLLIPAFLMTGLEPARELARRPVDLVPEGELGIPAPPSPPAEQHKQDSLAQQMPAATMPPPAAAGRARIRRQPQDELARLGQRRAADSARALPMVTEAASAPEHGLAFDGAIAGRNLDRETAAGERYGRFADNPFVAVGDQPLSTFSIDVDTASYANVRRFLAAGRRPPRDAVRIEELVNYFRYDYPQPTGGEPFSVTLEAATCPWRVGHRIVRVGLSGRDVERDARPAGNLVFLVDVSGSMNQPNKLPLVKQALTMLVAELSENDHVAIVTYAGNAGLVLPSTSGDRKDEIRRAIAALQAGGSTHGSAGITLAYEQAAERFIEGGANRVILCTDGDLNVGITSDEALVELIRKQARGGTFLTVLGFGDGNLQDEKLEKLADNGNGVYATIDGVREARKVLVEQLTGSTITIAKDVKIQVEFNPAQVARYRLLGYENRMLAARDFRDDTKDAGEIGAGHTVTALYEVVLVGEEAAAAAGRGAEPLKYQPAPPTPAAPPPTEGPASRELLTVKLRWKKPEGDTSELLEVPLEAQGDAFDAASADLRFAAAVAAFGMILRDSEHKGSASFPLVADIAGSALGGDAGGYRAEFLDLVRRAEALGDR
ncbi:MAG: von Willebrand factor type A domain-containing protein [Planctomycetota bacterium]